MEKVKIYVAFGKELSKAVYGHDIETIKEDINNTDLFHVREFDTQAEANAYMLGLDDNECWSEYVVLNKLNSFENQVINLINNR